MEKERALLLKISELEAEIKKLKKQKKYGLVWEDKLEQIVEDCKHNVPILRLKEKKKDIEPIIITDESKDHNILIEGDNYRGRRFRARTRVQCAGHCSVWRALHLYPG
ncbi:MAG: hypothetical protein ACOYMZ_02440 [Minisyncoccia bacterium]